MTIEATHYEETRLAFMADPIVQAMAEELPDAFLYGGDMLSADGTPRFEFMQMANGAYRRKGGALSGHIGAVAEAIVRLKGTNDGD
jgi:hypothetical protein